jgi:diadenosine tetraphosphate (Ap4A) HIT family hydrolase
MPELITVYETSATVATPCSDCDVPGYIIVRPRRSAATLNEAPEFCAELGTVLSLLERTILEVTLASKLYIARFSEAWPSVHFHLFPRSDDIVHRYLLDTQQNPSPINGPHLLGWAREHFQVKDLDFLSEQTVTSAKAIREKLSEFTSR